MKTLNASFPNLGNQLNELQEVATEFQKESTLANQSRYQDLVSGLLVDLMAKGIGREVTNNGFFTSVPCAETVTSKKSESGVHKRTEEGLQSPRTLTKKPKVVEGSLSLSKASQKGKKSNVSNEKPECSARDFLKKQYPSMIPDVSKAAARLFTTSIETLQSFKFFSRFNVNSDGWDLFCACVDQEDPILVHTTFFTRKRIKFSLEMFTDWFNQVKASVHEIKQPRILNAIQTKALEKMKDYFSESEKESENEAEEQSSDDDEV